MTLSRSRLRASLPVVIAAAIAYVPIVFSSPGAVGADTKTYLYLDPGKLLAGADTLWDSDVALGTVTHQTIGYLWPMGPYYWLMEQLGSPDWFAQRIWLGTVLFAAGLGVWFLLRTLEWSGRGVLVAMLAYELSPYLLDYSARISVVLLPWAGLPWMIALTVRAARSGGWRHPAAFALVVVTVGSVNATSLLMVGLAPVLWLGHAAFAERSLRPLEAARVAGRIGLLCVLTSLWWAAGLVLQGRYSLPVTRYTETYEVVADAATAPEILRGLGYWFFYGNDKFGQWIEPSIEYTQGVWLHFLSFGLVVLALLGAACVRWRHRSYFLLLLVVGALIGIGAHPFDDPSPLGRLFKDFTTTDAGLALRSTPRAVPMVVLATAVLLGALIRALADRWPSRSRPFAALVVLAIVLANPAMWRIRMLEEHLQRDENIPEYWLTASERLDEVTDGTRVWEVPGSDFASYRWGNTVDPITPGLMERGYVARELVPFGSAESAALVTAFDRRMQEGSLDADAVVPVARLMSVGDLVHRADLTFERFRTPRPVPTNALLESIEGLGPSESYGPPEPNLAGPQQTLLDEIHLSIDPALPQPAPVVRYPVDDPLPVIRLRPVDSTTVLVGDAEGIVDAAGAGLLDLDRTLIFGADIVVDPSLASEVLAHPVEIIVTDTNRKQARRWGTLRENVGAVEQPGETPLRFDPSDNRLPLFPAVDSVPGLDPDDTRTVALQEGPFRVVATAYGNPVTYTLDDRPVLAVDGDLETAWTVGAFAEARGEFLRLVHHEPVTLESITLVQPPGPANRRITEVRIVVDGKDVITAPVAPDRTVVSFPAATGAIWEIHLTDLDFPRRATYPGVAAVGFAEVEMGGSGPIEEHLRTPRAFLDLLGAQLDEHDLSVVLTRLRSDPREPVRGEPEVSMARSVALPTERSFEVSGSARLSPYAPSAELDAALGRGGELPVASASASLPGNLRSLASAAIDGDPGTAWTTPFGPQGGHRWSAKAPGGVTFESIELHVVSDSLHSVPGELRVWVDGVDLGVHPTGLELADEPRGTTRVVSLPVEAIDATEVTIEVVFAIERPTRDWYSNGAVAMPIAIAEADFGLAPLPAPADGVDVPVRITGDATSALGNGELDLEGCAPLVAEGGDLRIVTTPVSVETGLRQAFDIDQLVLRSPRPTIAPSTPVPLTTERRSDVEFIVELPTADQARWLVLGQSLNSGWQASLDGEPLDGPHLIDGFANGWRLPSGSGGIVRLEWTPQRLVGRMLLVSALGVGLCVMLARRGRRFMRPLRPERPDGPATPALAPLPHLGSPARRIRRRANTAWMAVVTVFVLLNLPAHHWLALVVAVLVLSQARMRRPAGVAVAAAGLLYGITALLIMIEQRRFRHPPDFVWPQQFDEYHVLGVAVILLVAAEYARAVMRPEGDCT